MKRLGKPPLKVRQLDSKELREASGGRNAVVKYGPSFLVDADGNIIEQIADGEGNYFT